MEKEDVSVSEDEEMDELLKRFQSGGFQVELAKLEVRYACYASAGGRWRDMWDHVWRAEKIATENSIPLDEIGLTEEMYKSFRDAPADWRRMLDITFDARAV